jgi:CubicO group peptidase (beta-lactamase class C family)
MAMEQRVRQVLVAAIVVTAGCGGSAGTAARPSGGAAKGDAARQALVAKIDSIVNAPITAGKVVGASIAVVKGRDTIAVQGFGKANMELDVPTPAHATYEIGSITKQFTGAAMMQLVEQGKISLDDDMSKYLPNVSTQGRKITVRRLLDHTSGIKGYTEMPEFRDLTAIKRPIDTLLKLISNL